MLKKVFSGLLCAVFLFCLTGCGEEKVNVETPKKNEKSIVCTEKAPEDLSEMTLENKIVFSFEDDLATNFVLTMSVKVTTEDEEVLKEFETFDWTKEIKEGYESMGIDLTKIKIEQKKISDKEIDVIVSGLVSDAIDMFAEEETIKQIDGKYTFDNINNYLIKDIETEEITCKVVE